MSCPFCGVETKPRARRCPACARWLAPPPSLHVGAVVASRYEIREYLGAGGMGVLFLAHDRVLDEAIALKVIHPAFVSDPDRLARFRREFKLARRVRSPNVCAVHQYGDHRGLLYVTIELVRSEEHTSELQSHSDLV